MTTPRTNNFGTSVSAVLAERSMSQTALAKVIDRTPVHVNHMLHARYSRPTASWVDLIANALDLTEDQRRGLHRAAALDNGFKL